LIAAIKNAAADFERQDKNQVSVAIYKLLGPKTQGGLGLLQDRNGDGSVTVLDILVNTNLPNPPSFGQAYAEWLLEIGGAYRIGSGLDFDIGIPGLGLETTGAIALEVRWSLMLGFGISGEKGVYFLLAPDARPELRLDAWIDFTGVSITGKLAFLELKATVKPQTQFGLTFAVDLMLDGSTATKLGITDFGDLSVGLKAAAVAKADLGLSLGLNSDIGSAVAGFPKIVADFIFDYGFGTLGTTGTMAQKLAAATRINLLEADLGDALWDSALKTVALNNIGLDIGTFLSDVIKPVVDEIHKAIEPVMPIIEAATTPIPVISDLAGEPVTLVTLAGLFGSVDVGMLESIADILKLIDTIASFSGDTLIIPFGSWTIYSKNPGALPKLWDEGLGSGALTTPTDPWGGKGFGEMLGLAQGSESTRNTMSSVSQSTGGSYGLKFPLFDQPTLIFQLFMGKDIPLVAYDLKPFSFEFGYEQYFPIIGPLGVSIGGSVGVAIDLGFGYSTRGIRQFVQNDGRNLALLLDGFYFMDVQGDPAEDVPELKVWGSITAAAQVNLVIAEAGVKGGIFLEIRFDLNDPDGDGMVHISELAANFMNEWRFGEKALAPLAIFDISGDITARLFAFIYVDLFFFSIDWEQDIVPPITIVDFEFAFGRHAVWANELSNGDVVLNVGPSANQRVHGPLDGAAPETVLVTGTRSSLMVNGQEYKLGATGKIVAKGGAGDDVIDLSGVTDAIDCIIDGGAGNDTIKAPQGTGKAIIYGGTGDDILEGGAGEDHIFGGPGTDTIKGHGGNDFLFGDEGTLVRGTSGNGSVTVTVGSTDGNDTIFGEADDGDTLFGSAGRDFIFGAGGKDTIRGGGGNDVIFGDSGQVLFSNATLALVDGADGTPAVQGTEAGKRGDADNLKGDDGDDFVFGGVGDDRIDGGEGRDFLFGETGKDTIKGGGGDDDLFGDGWWKQPTPPDPNHPYRPASGGDDDDMDGGPGNDRLWGGGGADTMKGGEGDDYLFGGPGNDTMYGDAAGETPQAGHDRIYGEQDNDLIFGGNGNDILDGGQGDDIVWGGYGPVDYTFGVGDARVSKQLTGPGDGDTLYWSAGTDLMDGQSGSDEYIIDFTGGTSLGRVYVFDSGVLTDGTDRMKVNGTAWADVFLLRGVDDGDLGLGFVAMLNADPSKAANMQPVERADYDNIERIIVNGHVGNDRFFVDDVHAECTLNGGAGEDVFQLGQMYRSERIYPNVSRGNDVLTDSETGKTYKEWVTPDYLAPVVEDPFPRVGKGSYDYPGGDQYMTIETTRGFLSRGVRFPITVNGGPGNDFFTVFHNEAVANLNGEAGDDVFLIKAFALAGSQEPKRGRTDTSGGDGTDLVMYVVNAPVNIDGGDGFDRVIIVGTEFGDDIVITKDGVYGAGLNVNYVNIESLEVDGAEGDDRFYVQSTSEKFVTRISGGLGNDTFSMSGDVPPVISNDLLGHSGIIKHSIEVGGDDGAGYAVGFKIDGISANIADDDEPGIRITQTGGGTAVTEGSTAYDEYTIVLTRAPVGDVVVRALVPARSPTDEELNAMHFRLASPDAYSAELDGSALTFVFTSAPNDWDRERHVRVYADLVGDDAAYEGTRSGFINHMVEQPLGTYRGTVSGIELFTIPDDTVQYDPKVRYETKINVTHYLDLDGDAIPNPFVAGELKGALFEIVDGAGIGQRMLIADNGEGWVQVFGRFRRDPDASSKYLIRRYQEFALPSVLVTVYDNDAADVAVVEIEHDDTAGALDVDGITAVVEGGDLDSGTPDRIAVVLTKALAAGETVVIELTNPDGQLVLGATELTFTSANWNVPQRVTVAATDDAVREGFHYGLVLLSVKSGPGDTTATQTDYFEHTLTPQDPMYMDALAQNHVFRPEAYVGLSFNPKDGHVTSVTTIEEGQTRTLDPSEYYVEGNLVVFLDEDGDPRMVTGKITIAFTYVKPGYKRTAPDELFIEPVLVEIADNEVPGVIIRESGGSTDVIETTTHEADGAPWTDTYTISLASAPAGDVWITVLPDFTKSTRGRIRYDLPQVKVSGGNADAVTELRWLENIRGVTYAITALKLKFTTANWDVPQTVTVTARYDSVVDGADTQVFAPKLHTVAGIQGPVYVEGAGGSGSLIDMSAQLLPGEVNKKEPAKPLQAYAVDSVDGTVTATVLLADALELAPDIDDGDFMKLLNRTLEITSGPAIDKFQLITAVALHSSDGTKLVLTLNEPYVLNPGEFIDTSNPANPTLYTITRESLNFFVDESKCIDFMFVYDEDSVADSSGRIQNLTTVGFETNSTVAEFVTRLEAKRLTGLQMGGDLKIGGYKQPGGITYGGLEVVEVNLGSGDNTFVIENTHYRTDFQTWTMVNTGKGDDEVTIAISQTRHTAVAAAGSTGNVLKLAGTSFAPSALKGFLLEITSGDLKGTRREIISNTADTLTLSAPWETGEGGALLKPAPGDSVALWLEDGPLAVNGQQGDDTIDGSPSSIPLVIFGSEGDDIIAGGSADDILFGDLGRVDYYDEQGRLVTRLGVDRTEYTGHTAGASNVVGPPALPEEWVSTFTSDGTPFASLMLDDLLTGCELQTVNGPGFGQFLFILSYTADTLTLRGTFDPLPYVEGMESTWRIPILPENQTDGVVRAPTLVMSRDRSVGGMDMIYGRAGDDLIIGGADADILIGDSFGTAPGDGSDVIFGDNGRMEFDLSGGEYDDDPLTLDRAFTLDPAFGGSDFIAGDGADDVILGGTAGDFIIAGAGDDLVLGDFGEVRFGSVDVTMLGALAHRVQYPLYATVTDDALGGIDTVFGSGGEDVIVGGAYGDLLDGGEGDDLIFGDNVVLDRRTAYSDFTNPRYRTAAGVVYDADGNAVVGSAPQNVPTLTGTPVWGNWDFTLLHHDSAQPLPSTLYGDDYIAGGPNDDMIFGQLGDDTIQGDGSIQGKIAGGGVSAARLSSGALSVVFSSDAATDGDDYIEGNGGADVIFGNLGQDDIVGGSSSLFSLTTRDRRPDGADLIFGGSGTEIERNDYGQPSHARDADAIAGDNANIYRIVAVGAGGITTYRTYNYDTYAGALRLIPRAVGLLDYTPGGPDYKPAQATTDIGAADELHGESGDDAIYGMVGNDVMFGESGDDDLIGGWGNDWISGGTGQDGVLGDDGRISTSRNSATIPEPLYGIATLLATDPDLKNTNGNVLDEFIYTPGKVQTATINKAGDLKKTVNLTPFNLDPVGASSIQDPLYRPLYADDIIYGGLGSDFLHAGAGDDAVSGAEALPSFYAAPSNPGNVLRYGEDKAGEFAQYDEYDPWSKVVGFLLNFDKTEGPLVASTLNGSKATDGDDVIFGDLGNDWLVGGTGMDTIYGGYGDDLLNADDDHDTALGRNTGPDTHPSYEDRAYGGAGRDVLIGNTGGDRLIDWVGEFNSYIVPFAPYGISTISRTLQPQLPEFLYALSASNGADPTRAGDTGTAAERNGEPEGELGLVLQKDADWHDQTGGPADPQAGNIPGGQRDVLRSASFNTATTEGFSADSGTWTVTGGRLEVAPDKLGGDAVSVFYVDSYLPKYYEVTAIINAAKPNGGYKANAYLIFDYRSATDFKFAGINISTNKLELGYRDASGWHVVAQTPAKLKPDTDYRVLLSVNGTYVTVMVDGKQTFAYVFAPHVDADGFTHMLNEGMVGIGADNAKARIDNVVVQILPPAIAYSSSADFDSDPSALMAAPVAGAWTLAGGCAIAAPSATQTAIALTRVTVDPAHVLRLESKLSTAARAGLVFDYYDHDDYKFAILDAATGALVLGHVRRGVRVVDATVALGIAAGSTRTLSLTLQGNIATVLVDGRQVLVRTYNALVTDGASGLIAAGGSAAFDVLALATSDPAVMLAPPSGYRSAQLLAR
jgi:Ca2+-binding RTX toxin-like protein